MIIIISTIKYGSTYYNTFTMGVCTHIAQNIAETCQKYFQSFIAIEILRQYFCQLF